ncbi:MAG: YggS family pyridoxal phosphate-dependent enzyme [Oscillospiraceae bacterium]|nr:YggS family pyridoxal phosphate-dependent enzyme [Oscillospiraceae bacterium]
MTIRENVLRVRERMEKAALAAGRRPEEIALVAASKMNDASRVREAVAAGVDACGENRVQELLQKLEQGAYEGAPLHFIGHLQKNKVRQIVGRVSLIHGADDVELLRLIDRCAAARGLTQDLLLEVNVGREPQKSGFAPEDLDEALESAAGLSHLRVRGLMAIPPAAADERALRQYFTKMERLFVDIGRKKYDNSSMDFLSMGMSGDFELAIACGSNLVRVGTAIFGRRPQPEHLA